MNVFRCSQLATNLLLFSPDLYLIQGFKSMSTTGTLSFGRNRIILTACIFAGV